MEAVYALLGLVFGIAIAEGVRWRLGKAGERRSSKLASGSHCSPTGQSAAAAGSSCRFTARDYYDR
jgi:hypothetical protein